MNKRLEELKIHSWKNPNFLLSPSCELGIGLVLDNRTPPQLFGPTVEILFKLNEIIYEESPVVLEVISDELRYFPMFSAVFRCFPTVFRQCFPTVENLFKLNYYGSPVVLSMISDDFRCFLMFSVVFRCFQLGCHFYGKPPPVQHFSQNALN